VPLLDDGRPLQGPFRPVETVSFLSQGSRRIEALLDPTSQAIDGLSDFRFEFDPLILLGFVLDEVLEFADDLNDGLD